MTRPANARRNASTTPNAVTAVITICASRKQEPANSQLKPVSLPKGSQTAVQTAWLKRLRTQPTVAIAKMLYAGRGFGLAMQAAEIANAEFYILSAGLGLIAAHQRVPSYGLTVSGTYADSVATRIAGDVDVAAWFAGLLSGPYAKPWSDVIDRGAGRILIALTRPYARMVGEGLAALGPEALARLRIFGTSLEAALPEILHPAIAPYDARLDAILSGTRADFPQRALLHFVRSIVVARGSQDRNSDYAKVKATLHGVAVPARPRRPRRSDTEILQLIAARLRSQSGIARLLRMLRDEEGVACEQARFSRLYRAALQIEATT